MKNMVKPIGTHSRWLCAIALVAVIGFSFAACGDGSGNGGGGGTISIGFPSVACFLVGSFKPRLNVLTDNISSLNWGF